MPTLHTSEVSHSPDGEPANGTVEPGEFVVRESGGGCARFDPANDSVDANTALALDARYADYIARHDEDFVDYDTLREYSGDGTWDGSDVVPVVSLSDGDVILPWTVDDSVTTEPVFDTPNEEVGIIDLGNGPRVVPSGYTEGGTTYSTGGAGDYVAIGYLDQRLHSGVTPTEQRVHVRVDTDL